MERRFVEIRAATGRRIEGTAVVYGDTAKLPWGALERFVPGAFAPLDDVMLNLMHQRTEPLARTGGGGLELIDDDVSLRFAADLPPTRAADDVLGLVRAGVLRGASIEFLPTREKMLGNVRVIERARLAAIGVVDTPAYAASEIEARARGGRPNPGSKRNGRPERPALATARARACRPWSLSRAHGPRRLPVIAKCWPSLATIPARWRLASEARLRFPSARMAGSISS